MRCQTREEADMRKTMRGLHLPRLGRRHCAECGKPSKELYCDVCGQELLRRHRDEALKFQRHF